MLRVRISIRAMFTIVCDKLCQWRSTCLLFSPGPPVSSINKTDRHDITEILLKVALKTIKQTNKQYLFSNPFYVFLELIKHFSRIKYFVERCNFWNYKGMYSTNIQLVSGWLLLSSILIFNEMIIRFALFYTNTLSWIFIVLAHWNNSSWIDMLLHSYSLSWFRANQSLLFLPNTNFITHDLPQRGNHANHYATDVVNIQLVFHI